MTRQVVACKAEREVGATEQATQRYTNITNNNL